MKNMFTVLKILAGAIAILIFACGLVLTALGVYDFVSLFSYLGSDSAHNAARLMVIGLLHSVDFFLVAIVFYVLGLGILLLFHDADVPFPVKLPEWLRIKDFLQLKVILWEAILTTIVVSYVANIVEKKIKGGAPDLSDLILPGAVLVFALSLYFIKKGEK